jgi:hypothetical protein
MRLGLLLFFVTVLAASLALPQTSPTAASKKTTTNTAKKRAATSKTASKTASRTTGNSASKKGRNTKKPVMAANRQSTPTPDRYREIQQALVDKGYLKSEPNGAWDAQSSDALRQFQTDRKLTPTGKISSASLIALGLGPKTASPQPGVSPPAGLPETPPATLPATAN